MDDAEKYIDHFSKAHSCEYELLSVFCKGKNIFLPDAPQFDGLLIPITGGLIPIEHTKALQNRADPHFLKIAAGQKVKNFPKLEESSIFLGAIEAIQKNMENLKAIALLSSL